ncbi:MAG TPA: GntR family transcriptional regulator [Solirubrobacterales bacterium]|jgi:DNA-binding FadR family transcriptional regulator|nr:GntR family transcriptional regulator [Solirubrobacterales bacterium]
MATPDDPPRASDRVHEALRDEILAGSLEPGAAVPSERTLAERFGVHRQSVREALKRLEQAGLVEITHGGATRVLDWRDQGGLEILADLADVGGGEPPAGLARSVIEMRASIGIDAARLCVDRASDAELAEVNRLAGEAAVQVGGPIDQLELSYAAMWRTVVIGSGNIAYRLAFNSLVRALPSRREMADAVRPDEADAIRAFGTAIRARDSEAATRCARELLAPGRT